MALKMDGLDRGASLKPLLSVGDGDNQQAVVATGPKKSKTCRYVTGTTFLASGATLTFFRYYEGWSNPVTVTFTAVGVGALTQAGTDTILPRHMVQKVHRFQQHYLTPELLALWQLYVNFPDIPWVSELALGTLCIIGGSFFVIKISSVAFKRMSDLHSNRKTYGEKERLNVALEPKSRCSKTCWKIFKAALGTGSMLASIWVKGWQTTLLNVGAFFLGHAVGATAQEFFNSQRKKLEYGLEMAREQDPMIPVPPSLRMMRMTAKITYIAGKTGWGMLVVANHPAAYGAIGSIIGATKSSEISEFVRMTAIKPEEELTPRMKIVSRIFNGTLCAGAHTYTLYAIATASAGIDRTVLTAFLLGGYTGYGTSAYLNRHFDPENTNTVMNTLQFYTNEHTDWLAAFYLYVKAQIELGDTELVNYSLLGQISATTAYGALGTLLGINMASPYELDQFQALGDAFVGKLLLERAQGLL